MDSSNKNNIVHNIGASFVSLTLDLVSAYPDHYKIPKIISELNILPWEVKRHFWLKFNKPSLMEYFWEDHPRKITRGLLCNLSQILSTQLNIIYYSPWFKREIIDKFPK